MTFSTFTKINWPDGVVKMRKFGKRILFQLHRDKLPWLERQRGYFKTRLPNGLVVHSITRERYILAIYAEPI